MHLSIKTGKLELETAAAPSLATKADDNGAKGGQGGAASFSLFLFLFFCSGCRFGEIVVKFA